MRDRVLQMQMFPWMCENCRSHHVLYAFRRSRGECFRPESKQKLRHQRNASCIRSTYGGVHRICCFRVLSSPQKYCETFWSFKVNMNEVCSPQTFKRSVGLPHERSNKKIDSHHLLSWLIASSHSTSTAFILAEIKVSMTPSSKSTTPQLWPFESYHTENDWCHFLWFRNKLISAIFDGFEISSIPYLIVRS